MKRRLPNPTRPAKQVWSAIWPDEPWPEGWTVSWVWFFSAKEQSALADGEGGLIYGMAKFGPKVIELNYPALLLDSEKDALVHSRRWREFFDEYPKPWQFDGVIATLLHELVHVRTNSANHGRRFEKLVRQAKKRLMSGR